MPGFRANDPEKVVREYLSAHPEVSALVLGASEDGPGPLVTHFSAHSGTLPCPLYVIPGGLATAEIDAMAERGA